MFIKVKYQGGYSLVSLSHIYQISQPEIVHDDEGKDVSKQFSYLHLSVDQEIVGYGETKMLVNHPMHEIIKALDFVTVKTINPEK